MNAPLRINLTPTELAAYNRSASFHAKIADAAEQLAQAKVSVAVPAPGKPLALAAALPPEAMPAETDPPRCPYCAARAEHESASWVAYPSFTVIVCEVARYYQVSILDIKSERRTACVVRPRQVAMYLCKELTPKSLPMIGRFFGGRDHSTVFHACRKIGRLCLDDPDLAFDVATLFDRIAGAL